MISSFQPKVLLAIHDRDASITLGLICETSQELARWSTLPVKYVIPAQKLTGKKLIAELHAANRKIFVWTVNSTAAMKRLAEWGVDGLISDHPGKLSRVLSEK